MKDCILGIHTADVISNDAEIRGFCSITLLPLPRWYVIQILSVLFFLMEKVPLLFLTFISYFPEHLTNHSTLVQHTELSNGTFYFPFCVAFTTVQDSAPR